jgi:SAM-dependent methyltransferase
VKGPATDPYAAIAALYDAEFDSASADAAWFARTGAGGPLLVLGCGTGRVCRLLEPLRPITGLDLSAPMLDRARARTTPGDRLTWVHGDMRTFDLAPAGGGRFAEILIPNAAFCFLDTRADQLACLMACARALASGAPLTLDLPAPDFALLAVPHTPERVAWEGTVDGKRARRTREVFRRALHGRLELVDRYWLDDTFVATSTLPLQLAFPRELEWLCEAAGFWVDAMYGDYAGGPLRDGGDRILVRAIRC